MVVYLGSSTKITINKSFFSSSFRENKSLCIVRGRSLQRGESHMRLKQSTPGCGMKHQQNFSKKNIDKFDNYFQKGSLVQGVIG